MSICIIGSEGNMARRYRAILKYLGKSTVGLDQGWTQTELDRAIDQADGVIVATPTPSHIEWIHRLAPYKKPILCEKPLSKDLSAIRGAFASLAESSTPFRMVFQYQFLGDGMDGHTLYDYWNHGRDGLVWDCIQIVGLARGSLELAEQSPHWLCQINGRFHTVDRMDWAYIHMIADWFKNPNADLSKIYDVHQKTSEFEQTWLKSRM